MIQSTMDLFIAPKVTEAQKPVHAGQSEGFSKIFEDMAGTSEKATVIQPEGNVDAAEFPEVMQAILDMLDANEGESEEPVEEDAKMFSVLTCLNIAQLQPVDEVPVEGAVEEPVEETAAAVSDVKTDVQPVLLKQTNGSAETILNFVDVDVVDEADGAEKTIAEALEILGDNEQDISIDTRQSKSPNITQPQITETAEQLAQQVKNAEKAPVTVMEADAAETKDNTAEQKLAPELKAKAVTSEETKSEKTDKPNKPEVENKEEKKPVFSKTEGLTKENENENEPETENDANFSKFGRKENDTSEKNVKREKVEQPEVRPSFTEFLNGVSEQRVAKAEGRPSVPLQYNLLNTGRTAFTEGMENVVRFAKSEGIDRATLIIDPPALGRVTIEIASTANGIETALKVSNEQVRALVQDQIVQLKHSLQQIGVQVTEFSVDIHQQDKENGQFAQQQQKNRAHVSDNKDDSENEEEVFRVDLRKGILHWIA